MKNYLFYITIMGIFLLGLFPSDLYADEIKDGPVKKTPEPKGEIIQLLKGTSDTESAVIEKESMSKPPVVPEPKPVKSEKKAEKTVAQDTSKDKKPVVPETKLVESEKEQSKTQITTSAQGSQTAKIKKVIIPNQGWEITFDAPTISEQYDSSKKSGYYYQGIAEGGFNILISVEKKKGSGAGHMAVYEYYWPLAKKNPLIDPTSINMSKHDKFVQVESVIKGENKKLGKFDMPHVNYYFEFNNKWIDVHISKLPFKKSEEILFKTFTDTLNYNNSN